MFLGFDPGKDKCGLAVMNGDRQLYKHEVIPSPLALTTIKKWCEEYGVEIVIIGNQTTSKSWQIQLKNNLPESISVVTVNERNSTMEARDRYWQMYPPRGLTKFLPEGMRLPPRPVDDLVAIILIERYLNLGDN